MHVLDISVAFGIFMLGMAVGTLLTRIRLRGTVARFVHEELERVERDKANNEGDRPDAA